MSLVLRKWFIIILGFLPILFAYNNCAPPSKKVQGALGNSSDGNGSPSGNGGLDGNGGGNGGLPGGGVVIPSDATVGEIFFLTTVVPKMNNSACINCHTSPRLTTTPAPLELFNYDFMNLKLAQGNSVSSNAFINKPLGVNHTGGNQCPGGPFSDPCKTFTDWAKVEYPTLSNGASGSLTSLSSRGQVTGWAVDPASPNATIQVHIYADGPVGSGTFLATVTANQTGLGGSRAGHYFLYQLPASFANGNQHLLYIYGDTAVSANLLPGMPVSYTAYTPTVQSIAYFNQSVAPALNACVGCHSITLDAQFAGLLTPSPANGGSATNNSLVIKGSGGSGHGGGNICGGQNGSPCAQIQQWWNIQFN